MQARISARSAKPMRFPPKRDELLRRIPYTEKHEEGQKEYVNFGTGV
jgi:hypothetical protein